MRRALIVAVVTAIVASAGPSATGWSNGRHGPDSFGTHDWVVREAVRAVGRAGRWVCLRKALRATDDPDTVAGIDHASATWWHVYDVWGRSTYGNAPEAVAVWFRRARSRLREGDRCGASRALGLLSHMLADVAQPMHTDQTRLEERVHGSYEVSVDDRCMSAATCRYRLSYDGPQQARPFRRTVSVATKAHRRYTTLVRRYARHGYDRRVDRITKRQLDRAAQALADLITSLR